MTYKTTKLPAQESGVTKTYLFGDPISSSLSPAFQNGCYAARGTASTWRFERFESSDIDAFMQLVHRGDCGGSAVTMPNKSTILSRPEIKEVEQQAKLIGASNTLYWRQNGKDKELVATNTDVAGIRDSILTQATTTQLAAFDALPASERTGLVIGGGGTTRTAVITLRIDLKCTGPIYIINRFAHEVQAIIDDFAAKGVTNIIHLKSPEQAQSLATRPHFIVNAIPSFAPTTDEERLGRRTLEAVLSLGNRADDLPRAFLEMCYFPHVWTDVCTFAKEHGWNVVTGEECMYLQGVAQQLLWAGKPPAGVDLRLEGRKGAIAEQERRAKGEAPL